MAGALIFALLLVGCPGDSCDNPTTPEPPPPTTTIPPEPEQPPRVDEPFSWDRYVGFSAFAAVGQGTDNARALYGEAMAHGYTTGRVCAELRSWDRHGLPVVPADIEMVDAFLDVTARIQGAQVLLECICNMKEDGASREVMVLWVQKIADLIREKDYKHVALSPGNELWHPASSIRGNIDFWNTLTHILRQAGQPVTVDWNAYKRQDGSLRVRYPSELDSDYPNLHPWRSPDPNRVEIREMVCQNGGRVLISEPTAYGGRDGGCCTLDKERIRLYACRAKREHALWTYHSEEGLLGKAPYSWWPHWDRACDGF